MKTLVYLLAVLWPWPWNHEPYWTDLFKWDLERREVTEWDTPD